MKQPAQAVISKSKRDSNQQTFLEHLRELRSRVFVIAIALVAGTCLAYALHDPIIHFLLSPLGQQRLVYLTPGGGFDFIFKVSLYFGVAITIPVIIYQLYSYLSPMILKKTKRFSIFVILMSCFLAVSGMAFGYFVALPAALEFLTGFAGDYVEANLTASSYLNFIVVYSLGLAAVFQIPLVLLLFNVINGPLKPSKLLSSEPYILLASLILAAMITPTPDIINQAVVAGPIVLMYQIGVMMVLWQNRSITNYCSKSIESLEPVNLAKFISPHKKQAEVIPRQPVKKTKPSYSNSMPKATTAKTQRQPVYNYQTMDGMSRRVSQRPSSRPINRKPRPLSSSVRRPARSIDGFISNSSNGAIDTANSKI